MKFRELEIETPTAARGCRPGHEVGLLVDAVEVRNGQWIAELGAGVGALAILLATRARVDVVGFENQAAPLEAARRNAELNAPRLRGRVRFELQDIRRLGGTEWEGRFHHVLANPPFYRVGQGRRPPRPVRAAARHEGQTALDDFVRAAALLLRPRGWFHVILRPDRLGELLAMAERSRCPVKRLLPVYTRKGADAKWIIATAVKGARPGLVIAPPRIA